MAVRKRKLLIAVAVIGAACCASAATDSVGDGTPDFLRLDREQDRAAFRRWFTFLAEVQYFNPPERRPAEIVDCASLLRYCYREALRKHDSRWAADADLPLVPAFSSIGKYAYPHTAVGTGLFRIRAGPFEPADLTNGTFAQFANASSLERFNTFSVGRDVDRVMPGDVLFFRRRAGEQSSYHSMIFVGRSHIQPDSEQYLVYDTGPDGASAGQMRRLTLRDLLRYPDPEWRPIFSNSQFLGVFRWNILHTVR